MIATLLVAFDDKRVMGKSDGGLPWHIPEDLKLFKKRTFGHTVICGRKTWDSLLTRPLPGRLNIILSHGFVDVPNTTKPLNNTSILVCDNIENAMTHSMVHYPKREIFIIGGLQIYELALKLNLVSLIIVSKIHGEHEGDISFPELKGWSLCNEEKHEGFDVLTYRE